MSVIIETFPDMAAKTHLTLPSGQKMPILGLGTLFAKDEQEIEQAITIAVEKGYRHLDTALVYENEVAIGKALKKILAGGKVKREDLFITTKLPLYGVHPDRVELFIKKSLQNLQLDYVDLYLIHFPAGGKYGGGEGRTGYVFNEKGEVVMEPKTDHAALWKKMEEQVDAGRAKNIGLSNYNISQIENLLKTARIKPANLQVELHIYLQQHALVDFCHKNGITVVAYCPLGSPGRNVFFKQIGKEPKKLPDILGDAVIAKIGKKHSKSPAQIALKYLVQRGVAPVPKSTNPKWIEENIGLFDFTLTEDDMKELNGLEIGEEARIGDWKHLTGIDKHPDYPFTAAGDNVCRR